MCNWIKEMPQEPIIARRGSVLSREVGAPVSNRFGGAAARSRIDQLPTHRAARDYLHIFPIVRGFSPTLLEQEVIMKAENESLMRRATSLGSLGAAARQQGEEVAAAADFREALDRKSTRLNSSHSQISYAVFCLKKKKKKKCRYTSVTQI